MLRLRDTLSAATQSLLAHPLRSGLTMLGVIIGNAAFIVMASLGESAKQYTVQRLEAFHGPNRLIVYSTNAEMDGKNQQNSKLYLGDAEALLKGVPAIKAVAPVTGGTFYGRVRNQGHNIWVTGTTADYLKIKNEAVATGRFFSSSELDQRSRVVVLGSSLGPKFFSGESPVGRDISIKNSSFRVIGIMRAKGSMDKSSPDEFAYVPLSTFSSYLSGSSRAGRVPVDYIEIGARSKAEVQNAIFQATNLLQARRGARNFAVKPNLPYNDLITQVSSVLSLFLAILAAISLLIGGIGIMNVMLVTVSERTSEIGLRKAVGARGASILMQFLIESTLLSAAGGLIGLLIGVAAVGVTVVFTPLPFILPLWSVGMSLSLSSLVGVIFGVSPASLASRLDPIVALRAG